jgi:hypothetical protein
VVNGLQPPLQEKKASSQDRTCAVSYYFNSIQGIQPEPI